MAETGLTKRQIVSELTRSTHGKLEEYVPVAKRAAKEDPDFLAHLIAWNWKNGQIRDSKVALPVTMLASTAEGLYADHEYSDNALAHLALLDPRNLVRGVRFARSFGKDGRRRSIARLVERYLREREGNVGWFDRTAIQHRETVKELYSLCRIKPGARAQQVLFDGLYPAGSIFEAVSQLPKMLPREAAGTILQRRIPFLIASGTLGKRMKEPDILLALIDMMSPTELVTNAARLQKMSAESTPAVRGALEQALQKASKSKKATLKTTKAAESVKDGALKESLKVLQEKQIDTMGKIEGDWAILADRSGSMEQSIEVAREIAAILARSVSGKVWLVFFNSIPTGFDVTGKTLEEIKTLTRGIYAQGGTSIGCALDWLMKSKNAVDGIAIVSDGGENQSPTFPRLWPTYSERNCQDHDVPIYFYRVRGDADLFSQNMDSAGYEMSIFDLGRSVDYYSLPNIVKTMRTNPYSLTDEILATPLLTVEQVFSKAKKTHSDQENEEKEN